MKMNEEKQSIIEMQLMREYGIMEFKLEIMKIIWSEPSCEAAMVKIKKLVSGDEDDK